METTSESPAPARVTFPCGQCGADLEFEIGAQALQCPFCGHTVALSVDDGEEIEERDLVAALERQASRRAAGETGEREAAELACPSCGARVRFDASETSLECVYCASPVQRGDVHRAEDRIPVDALLPFRVDRERVRQQTETWIRSRWFAPSSFTRMEVPRKLRGVYTPYWSFDALTHTRYTGQRGDDYTVRVRDGNTTRSERRTRWRPVSGSFSHLFDDVLIVASEGLPREVLKRLEPWPTGEVLPFTEEVLAGYQARTYDVGLADGFGRGKERMDDALRDQVKRRIGGDHQLIESVSTRYEALKYKHLLLPVWMMAYRHGEKVHRIVANGVTGEVQGERPWSALKIALAVVAALGLAAGVYAFGRAQGMW
ncbi:MAG: hypothetical protein MJE66_18165 [Proteobacteria bacterium]|nr:hypothetical protein [Pseudomonadota bacterium]